MNIINYYLLGFKRMFDFKGKSSLKEFWSFFIINIILFSILGFIRNPLGLPKYFIEILKLLILIPSLSIGFRRLNDAGINRWLFLLPIVNIILAGLPSKNNVA